jgi:protein TonB
MSQVSIFEKKWLDIVFENKNKEYGAYQLRKENSSTTLKALFFGIVFLFGNVFLLSSFSSKETPTPIIDDEDVIRVDKIYQPENEKQKTENKKSNPVNTTIKQPKNATMVVVKTPQAQPDVPTNDEFKNNNTTVTSPGGNNSGNNLTSLHGGGSGGGENTTAEDPNKVYSKAVLEENPSFPGGIDKFYEYVAKNFNASSDDEESEITKVTVSFVIEKDGSLSNIKIVNSTNVNANKEAIRVLKSLKTKWFPGKMGNNAVRTQYMLPITINMNP